MHRRCQLFIVEASPLDLERRARTTRKALHNRSGVEQCFARFRFSGRQVSIDNSVIVPTKRLGHSVLDSNHHLLLSRIDTIEITVDRSLAISIHRWPFFLGSLDVLW